MDDRKVEGLDQHEGSHVKNKSFLMMKGRPCICTKVSFAKPGKHGHVKCNIVGQDLLKPDKKYQHMCPGHEMIEIPIVQKYDLAVTDIGEVRDGKEVVITEIVTMTEDSKEHKIRFRPDLPEHQEAVAKFKELEVKEDVDHEVLITMLYATVGEKGKYEWMSRVEKVSIRDAD